MRARLLLSVMLLAVLVVAGGQEAAAVTISTSTEATLGGATFQEGDQVEYDKVSDTTATPVLFDGDALFSLGENVDSVHVVDSDNIILSTQNGATLGGLTFANGDLVSYNLLSDTATLYFSETLFSGSEDINAASILPNNNIVLSTTTAATLGV